RRERRPGRRPVRPARVVPLGSARPAPLGWVLEMSRRRTRPTRPIVEFVGGGPLDGSFRALEHQATHVLARGHAADSDPWNEGWSIYRRGTDGLMHWVCTGTIGECNEAGEREWPTPLELAERDA